MNNPPELFLFLGRFHPLVAHLPIGLFLLVALLEFLARTSRFKHANSNAGIILALAAASAVLTASCGWLLSLAGGYQDRLLQLHKWTGIATATLCLLAAFLYRFNLLRPYRWSLFCGCGVLVAATHFGGSLTHGSDYLTRYAPGPVRNWLSPSASMPQPAAPSPQAPVYSSLIQPILQENCIPCHGPEKSKGGLRLDSLEALLKGGENGVVIVPGQPAEAQLLKRVRLPVSHEDHMPPEGKPQPSQDDIALLGWWILNGAPANKTADQLNSSPAISRILASRFGTAAAVPEPGTPKPLDQAVSLASQLADELHVVLTPISASEPWFQCNASLAGTNFGDSDLARLSPLGANLRWLDLGGTGISDTGLAVLAQMPNLTRLHLERTAITDSGLGQVSGLAGLEYLNLHHTGVTDVGLKVLSRCENLRQVYLWETKVTPEAAKAFAEAHSDQGRIDQWRQEIDQLEARIRRSRLVVDIGATPSRPATNAAPINTVCPVSGKPVDPTQQVIREGKIIAFCCGDCRAKFQQDPAAYLSKLEPLMPKEAKTETSK